MTNLIKHKPRYTILEENHSLSNSENKNWKMNRLSQIICTGIIIVKNSKTICFIDLLTATKLSCKIVYISLNQQVNELFFLF